MRFIVSNRSSGHISEAERGNPHRRTMKNTFRARFVVFPFALLGSILGACFRSNKLRYMVWYTLGLSAATTSPAGVVLSGGFPFTPPGTYSRHTAKYPAATSDSWVRWNFSASWSVPDFGLKSSSVGKRRGSVGFWHDCCVSCTEGRVR